MEGYALENRKEGHLYLVTEDRHGKVYLWDFTEKSETEFLEENLPSEVLQFATEGAMLQYKDGQYILYSPYGYDMLEDEEEEEKEAEDAQNSDDTENVETENDESDAKKSTEEELEEEKDKTEEFRYDNDER